ncbi:N-acetylglucosamine 6-phosphate deacetylase [Poseidonocella pacifica]|uniref:N-acetylglucosamine 6-phosphate deacetylase n=1 Tax=Poseidonocella pacifica TaxID=871651 RepID=A0A1I0WRP1_9RHOB|nr:N-acetylglucosamine-6-phosphate deacetylase [Poseidonocella pacifica]SFA91429.1 N-acetylglucosamine 6-phosphate deacetylase [Poseidonocella pacifica]
MTRHLIHAEILYDGTGAPPQSECLVEVLDGRIVSVGEAPSPLPAEARREKVVAPGFIDLQINGAADVQFNDTPTAEAAARIAAGARSGGAAHILPTFITAPGSAYLGAISAVQEALARQIPGILGLHLEGPFLSPLKPGIHPQDAIRPLEPDDIAAIRSARLPLLLTLAPEAQPREAVRQLSEAGVVVFAGHSAATAEELDAAARDGLSGVTHLWNAMPPPEGRAPGIVSRALTHPMLFAGIIADGHHVHPLNLTLAAKMMAQRLFLVSDTMRTYAGTSTEFDLLGTQVTLADGRLTGPDGRLAGAHLGMDDAVRFMVAHTGVEPETAIAMATSTPARAMRQQEHLGRIAPGFRASLTFLDVDLRAKGGMVDGRFFEDLPAI